MSTMTLVNGSYILVLSRSGVYIQFTEDECYLEGLDERSVVFDHNGSLCLMERPFDGEPEDIGGVTKELSRRLRDLADTLDLPQSYLRTDE